MLRNLFTRRPDGRAGDISEAARKLALEGVERRRAKRRAFHDKMRSDLGLPAWEWRT